MSIFGFLMPQYLVPCSGFLVIEAGSSQQAEIMALTWGQSLLRRKAGTQSAQNTTAIVASQNNVRQSTAADVKAVSMRFAQTSITDITSQVEADRTLVVENDREYRQGHGLPETDLMDEQLVLFALEKVPDES
jgi:alpha-D-ribose 1-methylphosphonate 5-phosphate C-P lyase